MPGVWDMNFSKTVNPLKNLQLATQSQQAPQNSYFNLLKWQPKAVQFKSGTELGHLMMSIISHHGGGCSRTVS